MTSSVAIAGVLLVFCYLIVPSVAAMLYAERIGPRLAIGWTMGTLVSALGIYLSLKIDLPTGATIVCTFGLVLIVMALLRGLVRRSITTNAPQPSRRASSGNRTAHVIRDYWRPGSYVLQFMTHARQAWAVGAADFWTRALR